MNKEWQEASNERAAEMKLNPITGAFFFSQHICVLGSVCLFCDRLHFGGLQGYRLRSIKIDGRHPRESGRRRRRRPSLKKETRHAGGRFSLLYFMIPTSFISTSFCRTLFLRRVEPSLGVRTLLMDILFLSFGIVPFGFHLSSVRPSASLLTSLDLSFLHTCRIEPSNPSEFQATQLTEPCATSNHTNSIGSRSVIGVVSPLSLCFPASHLFCRAR